MESMSETAEGKYLKFIKTYHESLQRIPQHMIASYLGITRETLSRLRKEIVAGKKPV
jgi:CRP-like cAMP-binding protein